VENPRRNYGTVILYKLDFSKNTKTVFKLLDKIGPHIIKLELGSKNIPLEVFKKAANITDLRFSFGSIAGVNESEINDFQLKNLEVLRFFDYGTKPCPLLKIVPNTLESIESNLWENAWAEQKNLKSLKLQNCEVENFEYVPKDEEKSSIRELWLTDIEFSNMDCNKKFNNYLLTLQNLEKFHWKNRSVQNETIRSVLNHRSLKEVEFFYLYEIVRDFPRAKFRNPFVETLELNVPPEKNFLKRFAVYLPNITNLKINFDYDRKWEVDYESEVEDPPKKELKGINAFKNLKKLEIAHFYEDLLSNMKFSDLREFVGKSYNRVYLTKFNDDEYSTISSWKTSTIGWYYFTKNNCHLERIEITGYLSLEHLQYAFDHLLCLEKLHMQIDLLGADNADVISNTEKAITLLSKFEHKVEDLKIEFYRSTGIDSKITELFNSLVAPENFKVDKEKRIVTYFKK
jgi:hypothetical protein